MSPGTIDAGRNVRVRQCIQTRQGAWEAFVDGEVVSWDCKPTGSWYAHGKNDRLWLSRLRLRRDDGEIVDLVLDKDSVVTPL